MDSTLKYKLRNRVDLSKSIEFLSLSSSFVLRRARSRVTKSILRLAVENKS